MHVLEVLVFAVTGVVLVSITIMLLIGILITVTELVFWLLEGLFRKGK